MKHICVDLHIPCKEDFSEVNEREEDDNEEEVEEEK
jgi:hypothetical protein